MVLESSVKPSLSCRAGVKAWFGRRFKNHWLRKFSWIRVLLINITPWMFLFHTPNVCASYQTIIITWICPLTHFIPDILLLLSWASPSFELIQRYTYYVWNGLKLIALQLSWDFIKHFMEDWTNEKAITVFYRFSVPRNFKFWKSDHEHWRYGKFK